MLKPTFFACDQCGTDFTMRTLLLPGTTLVSMQQLIKFKLISTTYDIIHSTAYIYLDDFFSMYTQAQNFCHD